LKGCERKIILLKDAKRDRKSRQHYKKVMEKKLKKVRTERRREQTGQHSR